MIAPVALTTAELLAVLDDLRAGLVARDSFDGSIAYHVEGPVCPECSRVEDGVTVLDLRQDCPVCSGWGALPVPEGKDFWVSGLYRIGNSEGQGGMRIIGTVTGG